MFSFTDIWCTEPWNLHQVGVFNYWYMMQGTMELASSWCFHLLIYDARNHETCIKLLFSFTDIWCTEPWNLHQVGVFIYWYMMHGTMKLASSWCFHLLIYDARNHGTCIKLVFSITDIWCREPWNLHQVSVFIYWYMMHGTMKLASKLLFSFTDIWCTEPWNWKKATQYMTQNMNLEIFLIFTRSRFRF